MMKLPPPPSPQQQQPKQNEKMKNEKCNEEFFGRSVGREDFFFPFVLHLFGFGIDVIFFSIGSLVDGSLIFSLFPFSQTPNEVPDSQTPQPTPNVQ